MSYGLTEEEWKKFKGLLKKEEGKSGRPCSDLRRTLSGIKWVLKTGCPWRALPPEFGNWNSVYRYFCRMQERGDFERIFAELTKDVVEEEVSLDSTFVKVHRHGLGAKKGLQILNSNNT